MKYSSGTIFFPLEKQHTSVYPVVSKTLREYYGEKAHNHEDGKHCCGMMMAEQGVGFEDLNELLKNPKQLKFILGLYSIIFKIIIHYSSNCLIWGGNYCWNGQGAGFTSVKNKMGVKISIYHSQNMRRHSAI